MTGANQLPPRPTYGEVQEDPSVVRLLTVAEACRQLRVSRWMLYRLIQTRQLQTVKLGSRRLVPVDALNALIRSRHTDQEIA